MKSNYSASTPNLDTHADGDDPSGFRARSRLPYKPRRDALTRVRHDLRSLVHAVSGYSDLLASTGKDTLTADQQRFVAHVRSAATQLEELVDACIELACPAGEQSPLEDTVVALSAALQHVRAGLAADRLGCTVDVAGDLAGYQVTLDLRCLLRAFKSLTTVLSREGARGCVLRALRHEGRVVIRLTLSSGAVESPHAEVEALSEELGNREFIRLKLSEVLLLRQGVSLTVSRTLDAAELRFA